MRLIQRSRFPVVLLSLLLVGGGFGGASVLQAAESLMLVVPPTYLPDVPILVRVELRDAADEVRRDVWDAEAQIEVSPDAGLSTNRIRLRNGLGSALVTLSGGEEPTLTASWNGLEASRSMTNVSGASETEVGGPLSGSATTWSGVVRVSSTVTVPAGHVLTIAPGALVLFRGTASGTSGTRLIVNGSVRSRGTEAAPVTLTCGDPGLRWGQISHENAQPSLYEYTAVTLAGRAPGEGHTGTGPAFHIAGSQVSFSGCSITDHADSSGQPGKIMSATASELVFVRCDLSRARMGPEISGTSLICQNTWITEMRGPDDSDGFYVHTQAAGQEASFSECVIAGGDDDGIDTLGADIVVEDCILRDWLNPAEDAKAISVFNGETRVVRSLVANCFAGVAAKSDGPQARVVVEQSTITTDTVGLSAVTKANASAGNVLFLVTNAIVQAAEAIHTDFGATNFQVGYCVLSTGWSGAGIQVADPQFMDASTNFHLQATSPCIDAGDPARGREADGTRTDIGVYPRLQTLAAPPATGVVISEIMYHPASEDTREEYLELWNRATNTVDLSGWRFTQGVRFLFPANTLLPAGAFLVVAADLDAFTNRYGSVDRLVGNWEGILSNNRQELRLEDAAGRQMAVLRYADEGDWGVRHRGPLDYGHRGWRWSSASDGIGPSAELIQPDLGQESGQNWAPSLEDGGTPGRMNSVAATNVPPLISDVAHTPLVPRSTDPVLITARVRDERHPVTLVIQYRLDSILPQPFLKVPMFDDGLHEDGAAGDGFFGGTLPAQPADTVVEFYVRAVDDEGRVRTWPAPAVDQDGTSLGQAANLLYQVDDATYAGGQPLCKLILRENDRAELAAIGATSPDANSNAQMNATFLSVFGDDVQCRYLVGVRNRGHGSRTRTPHNYRVNLRGDDPWNGVVAINLNGQYSHVQHFGALLALRSGAAGADARAVQIRINNGNPGNNGPQTYAGVFVLNEVLDSNFAEHRFPLDSSGNLYRCIRTDTSPRVNADLVYRGTNASDYANTYFKETNASEDDWTDLIELTRVLTETPDAEFVAEVERVADVGQWLTYLAIMALYDSRETGLNTSDGDDYAMYRGENDRRFRLFYYDLDTILGQGSPAGSPTATVFGSTNLTVFGRLLNHPTLRTRYYQTLARLLDTTFAATEFEPALDQTLTAYVPENVRSSMKTWMASRRAHVRSLLPAELPSWREPRATLAGVPRSPTPLRHATLRIGGESVTHYRFRLNGGDWSATSPISQPIELSDLPDDSTNVVEALGQSAEGTWQAQPTLSSSWVVRTAWPGVRLNELLARNDNGVPHEATFPDMIELFNEGAQAVDLAGLRLTDDAARPGKFSLPARALEPGEYLVLYANNPDGTSGLHTGFALDQAGEGLYLFDRVDRGGALLDAVEFGPQLANRSIGRIDGGDWTLTSPSFGAGNVAAELGDPGVLRINEWLADGRLLVPTDFIELHNPGGTPVALGGLLLTDNLIGNPARHVIPRLTFLAPGGYFAFVADGDADAGPDHLGFRLAREQGEIGLLAGGGYLLDSVFYGAQQPDVSEGRTPNGGDTFQWYFQPTPGAANPETISQVQTQVFTLVTLTNLWRYNQTSNYTGVPWMEETFDDSSWLEGRALLYYESDTLPADKNTQLELGRRTYYFRTQFRLEADPAGVTLRLSSVIDDGAVFYLNGQELPPRLGIEEGIAVTYDTWADRTVNAARLEGPISVPSTWLRRGTNLLAAEVHQVNDSSSDVVFALALDAVQQGVSLSATDILLNEVLSTPRAYTNATGRLTDWIELFNPSTNTTSLENLSLSDQLSDPRKWVFPAGSSLAPGAYLLVECDPDQPPSTNNTGFGLSAVSGAVHLFHRPDQGGGLLDSLSYGLPVADLSLGRMPDAGSWSLTIPTPGSMNIAAAQADPNRVRINEWSAADPAGPDWVELFNPNSEPVALSGLSLTDDPADRDRSPFPPLCFLAGGTGGYLKLIADNDPAAGADHLRFQLDAAGDSIGLYGRGGTQVDAVAFGPQSPSGSAGRLPDGGDAVVRFAETVSPGAANYLLLPNVVIHEVLTHTDPPLEDAVELHNPTTQAVDIGGWFLSDDPAQPRKFQLPEPTVIAPGGFVVFYEYQFNADTNLPTSFAFSSARGDQVVLAAADDVGRFTGYRALAEFGAAANGVSFGRHPTTKGYDFAAMSRRTFGVDSPFNIEHFRTGQGAPNAAPRSGPVGFTEVMFHPPDEPGGADNTADEFIELVNFTSAAVPLSDPAAATNTWSVEGTVRYRFPTNVVLAAQGVLLLVSFDPLNEPAVLAAFTNRYQVPSTVPILGPWSGRLNNDDGRLALYQPDPPQTAPSPDAGYVPQVLVEHVQYGDRSPWPPEPDGTGASLQRRSPTDYANEPLSWFAAAPAPGKWETGAPVDGDEDGLPDDWEQDNGLDPGNGSGVNGADGDLDQDGMTNLEEYLAGTAPNDPSSVLRLEVQSEPDWGVVLRFQTAAQRSYSILARDDLTSGAWVKLVDVEPQPVSGAISVPDPDGFGGRERYYLVVTPALP